MEPAGGVTLDSGREEVAVAGGRRLHDGQSVGGRYQIVRFIAEGGMGEVYEADDLLLGTSIALKTIRRRAAGDRWASERFLSEIRLAHQVSHPNVCRIFDIGQDGDTTFLSMELLPGETLAQRLGREGKMTAATALPIIAQLCAALDAAHAAGVIHRDFKSQNVILVPGSGGGRAVVTDFGLARPMDDRDAALEAEEGMVGTPAYVAPEQVARDRGKVTRLADIYALGVVLYEMMAGRFPFEGDGVTVIHRRLHETAVSPRVHAPDLSRRWERAIMRCLAARPEERCPSAGSVLEELRGPGRRGRRNAAFAVAAALLAVTATFAIVRGRQEPAREAMLRACRDPEPVLAAAWSTPRRHAVAAALATGGGPGAAATVAETVTSLELYSRKLSAAHRTACEASVLGGQSARVTDLRAACLGLRRTGFVALVDLLAGADATVAAVAGRAASRLPEIEDCLDVQLLLELPDVLPADPDRARAIAGVRQALMQARIDVDTRRIDQARALLDEAVPRARELGRGLEAEALYIQAFLDELRGDARQNEAHLRASVLAAQETGNDLLVARASAVLALVVLSWGERIEEARAWAELSLATTVRLGGIPRAESRARFALAAVSLRAGELDVAEAQARRALTLGETADGPMSLGLGDIVNTLGGILRARGRLEEAQVMYERALGVQLRLSRRSRAVSSTLSNLAGIADDRDDLPRSIDLLRKAVAMREEVEGAEHPHTADALVNLASVLVKAGATGEALAMRQRALAIHEKALGRDHPRVVRGRIEVAEALLGARRPGEAAAVLAEIPPQADAKVASEVACRLVSAYRAAGDGRRAARAAAAAGDCP